MRKKVSCLEETLIYTTGAYLIPLKVQKENGVFYYVWVVSGFEDNTYDDNGDLCYPESFVKIEEELFADLEEE